MNEDLRSVSRRRFAKLVASAALLPQAALVHASGREPIHVNASRLQRALEGLSVFGRPAGGTFADGVSRVAYSDADVAGRSYAMELMLDAALDVSIDSAGNIIGRRAGRDHSLKPIVMGSHIDSVRGGGNFDGQLGSMAAIEVVRVLKEAQRTTRHPLEVRIWSNEESGTIGSSLAAGFLSSEILDRTFNDIRAREGLQKIGGNPDRLSDAHIAPGSFRCYLELHIEQGGFLDKAGVPIGVVDGIVSIDDFDVEIRGFANHAGTTPMPDRQDALIAAAKLIEAVREIVTRSPGRQVGTVGRLEVFPNAPNVIPGLVKHSIELRDLSEEKVAQLGAEIAARAQVIASETHTQISMTRVEHLAAALADPAIQQQIESAARTLSLPTLHLPSGAGHDAQVMAKLGPMGMIFVPSLKGISHSPKELSRWSDCANGADVLLQTVLGIDRQPT